MYGTDMSNFFSISPLSYPYLIAAATTTKPYEDAKIIPAANRTNGVAAEVGSPTNQEEEEGQRLYRRWQEIGQLNTSLVGTIRELTGFLFYELLPYSAAALGRIENKESAGVLADFFLVLFWSCIFCCLI